jgi:phosphoheptose isomerase
MRHPVQSYFNQLSVALAAVSSQDLDRATLRLLEAYDRDSTVFVIGNGQSATSSTAFALDLTKQSLTSPEQQRVRIISLADNIAALTAWANDVRYEVIFTEQLRALWRPGDLLLAVSVSGNSPNVVHACRWARNAQGSVVALTGFQGGLLASIAASCIVVPSSDFGIVETAHVAIMHYWVDLFRERLAP